MDLFWTGVQQAQTLAQQAQRSAAQFAESASEKTKEFAMQVSQKDWNTIADEAKQRLQSLSIKDVKGMLVGASEGNQTFTEAEKKEYSVTEESKAFVRSLTYSTFREYSNELADQDRPGSNAQDASTASSKLGSQLDPWQLKHAQIMLSEVEELEHLRFVLCPSRMNEQQFWQIYFLVIRPYIGATTAAVSPATDPHHPAPAAAQTPPTTDASGASAKGRAADAHGGKGAHAAEGGAKAAGGQGSNGVDGGDENEEGIQDLDAYIQGVLEEENNKNDGDDAGDDVDDIDIDEYLEEFEDEKQGNAKKD